MEPNEPENKLADILSIRVTENAAANLRTSALWGRAMAYIGFANLLISILALAKTLVVHGSFGTGYITGVLISSFIGFVMVLFLYLFLYRYASKMLLALNTESQEKLTESFAQLKAYFKFIGILFILSLALLVLSALFGRI